MSTYGDVYAPEAFPSDWINTEKDQGGFVVGPDCWRKYVIKNEAAHQSLVDSVLRNPR